MRIILMNFFQKIRGFLIDYEFAPWIVERLECYIFNPKYSTI